MSGALAAIGRGFARPANDAQQIFRALLGAMARPGRVVSLPAQALAGLQPPQLSPGIAALLLTLLDAETTLWVDPPARTPLQADYLRFHTGVRLVDAADLAAFALVGASRAAPALWSALEMGSDEAPQLGSTLVVEVEALHEREGPDALRLRGPGIEHEQVLAAQGLDAAFWQARKTLEADYPRGIDLVLCAGDCIAALPRSTRITNGG